MTITIGCTASIESHALAGWIRRTLGSIGEVTAISSFTSRSELLAGLLTGGVDMAPEYAAALLLDLPREPLPTMAEGMRQLRGALYRKGLVVLGPARARDVRALAMRSDHAAALAVRNVAEVVRHAPVLRAGGPSRLGVPVWKELGLARTPSFASYRDLDHSGPLLRMELARRELDVVVTYSSDPHLPPPRFTLFAADDIGTLTHNIVVLAHVTTKPVVVDAVRAGLRHLTTSSLLQLNQQTRR